MGSRPLNLAFRFILELVGLFSLIYWGWAQVDGLIRYVLAIGLPFLAAVVWGMFNVPGDPSRSGKAPVPVPGWVRLLIELVYFSLSAWCLWDAGAQIWSLIFAGAVLLHYALSVDRIRWLLSRQP